VGLVLVLFSCQNRLIPLGKDWESFLQGLITDIARIQPIERYGRVSAVQGLLVEVEGTGRSLSIGSRTRIESNNRQQVFCEVIGFKDGKALLMPFSALEGVGIGARVYLAEGDSFVYPDDSWLGRVVNALGEPLDEKGPLLRGGQACALRAQPPKAHSRQRVGEKLDLGVRAMNSFVSVCRGQRMGIFSGSGVGKSVLLSMLARYAKADVTVIGLIGERGRELQEFIEDDLGPEGLARSVLVVATSDESALMRRQAAYLTMSIAEYFRDKNKEVICLMDSITRFAMAQREIGLAGGEPPASRGYTPTVFGELPKLLERAGPGARGSGNITGLFSVLVEGDDLNEPITDAVRGILDGHLVMERSIADRGRFPAINILRSISRTMPKCNTDEENELVNTAKKYISAYSDMEEMIRLGAYRAGTNPELDLAIQLHPHFENFLSQNKDENTDLATGYQMLANILASAAAAPQPEE
jgi:flagellum-specific ATP synthase